MHSSTDESSCVVESLACERAPVGRAKKEQASSAFLFALSLARLSLFADYWILQKKKTKKQIKKVLCVLFAYERSKFAYSQISSTLEFRVETL